MISLSLVTSALNWAFKMRPEQDSNLRPTA